MKKVVFYIISFLILCMPISASAAVSGGYGAVSDGDSVVIHLFYSEECPHCHREREWLKTFSAKYPNAKIKYYEREDYSELVSVVRNSLSVHNSYVPLTVIGSDYFIGYNEDIQKQIEEAFKAYSEHENYCDIVSLLEEGQSTKGCKTKNNGIYNLSSYRVLPIIGEVNTREVSLPLVAIVIGFVDGFNPCAMWVLIFLITMMLDMKNRKKMWILGLTFLISSAFIYLLFMVSWLGISGALLSTWFRYGIGIIAIAGSIYNLRKFWLSRKKAIGCEVTSKEKKTKIIARIEKVVKEKNYFLAIIGMIVLAFSVNVVELACSAGLPLLFTQILTLNQLSGMENIIYMGIYIFFFLLDDIIIFIIAMTTLKVTGISNKYTKYSSLIGGIIMLLIGILLIVKPGWIMFNF